MGYSNVVRDVVAAIHKSATLDWTKSRQRHSALRGNVKRALLDHGFDDIQTRDNLVELIFEQALRIAA